MVAIDLNNLSTAVDNTSFVINYNKAGKEIDYKLLHRLSKDILLSLNINKLNCNNYIEIKKVIKQHFKKVRKLSKLNSKLFAKVETGLKKTQL